MFSGNKALIIAAVLSALGGIIHLGIIIGGPDWYRFFGAGEEMAQMAEKGLAYPAIATGSIALILFVWSIYAFSGAGIIKRLPLLKTGLVLIASILMIRALLGFALVSYINQPYYNELQARPLFMLVTSIICFVYAVFYIIGTFKSWKALSVKKCK